MLAVFSRYLAVQIAAYGADMGTFLLATELLSWSPLSSNVIAKMVAGMFAFIAHRWFTFGVHGKGGGRMQLLKYAVLLALNIPISSAILALLLPLIAPDALAKITADVICVGITFFISRRLVFTHPDQGSA